MRKLNLADILSFVEQEFFSNREFSDHIFFSLIQKSKNKFTKNKDAILIKDVIPNHHLLIAKLDFYKSVNDVKWKVFLLNGKRAYYINSFVKFFEGQVELEGFVNEFPFELPMLISEFSRCLENESVKSEYGISSIPLPMYLDCYFNGKTTRHFSRYDGNVYIGEKKPTKVKLPIEIENIMKKWGGGELKTLYRMKKSKIERYLNIDLDLSPLDISENNFQQQCFYDFERKVFNEIRKSRDKIQFKTVIEEIPFFKVRIRDINQAEEYYIVGDQILTFEQLYNKGYSLEREKVKPIILTEDKRQKLIEKCIEELYEKTFKDYLDSLWLPYQETCNKAKYIESIIDDMYKGEGDPNESKKRALEKINAFEESFNVFLDIKTKFDREFDRIESFVRSL